MKLRKSPLAMRGEQGFTLIELMVALAAFSIVSLAAFAVLDSGQRNALMNDQTVKVQQNVRLAMDLIARDIRLTGYGNPAALLPCVNHMNAADNVVGADGGPDTISVMTLSGQVGVLNQAFTAGGTIQVSSLSPTVVIGSVVTLEGVFTAAVTGVGAAGAVVPVALANGIAAPAAFPAGTRVFDLACVTYTVSNAGATPPFQLMRAVGTAVAVPIVDGIESLQLAYAVDTTGTGAITDQNGSLTVDCKDFIPNDSATNGACVGVAGAATNPTAAAFRINATPSAVRQVRITVVGRAIPPANFYLPGNCWRDPTFTGSAVIIAEDQVLTQATSLPVACGLPQSGIRRRALTRVVSLRETTLF